MIGEDVQSAVYVCCIIHSRIGRLPGNFLCRGCRRLVGEVDDELDRVSKPEMSDAEAREDSKTDEDVED